MAIAAEHVAKSAPDGYTVLAGATTVIAANPALFKQLSYNPRTDFDAVVGLGTIPQVVVVHQSVPAANMAEFIAYAKTRTGVPRCARFPVSTCKRRSIARNFLSSRRATRIGSGAVVDSTARASFRRAPHRGEYAASDPESPQRWCARGRLAVLSGVSARACARFRGADGHGAK